jgi:hypothetical protein
VKGKYRRPLFKPSHLGAKYPIVDFIVDVLAPDSTSLGFFFVQVKSTSRGNNPQDRLPIPVEAEKFNFLARLPAPTYLIGVDVNSETSHIVAAHKPRSTAISSITRSFRLTDDDTKIDLYKEVLGFWNANRPILQRPRFKDV